MTHRVEHHSDMENLNANFSCATLLIAMFSALGTAIAVVAAYDDSYFELWEALILGVMYTITYLFWRCYRQSRLSHYDERTEEYTIRCGKIPIHGPEGYVHGTFALGFGTVEGRLTTEASVSVIYVDRTGKMRSYTQPIDKADLRNTPGSQPTFKVMQGHYVDVKGRKEEKPSYTEYTITLDFDQLFTGHGMYQAQTKVSDQK